MPAGVGAVLTGLSLLIAAFAYRHSVEDRKRSQVDNFAVWIAYDHDEETLVLVARNSTSLPALDVRVKVVDGESGKDEMVHFDVVPPGENRRERILRLRSPGVEIVRHELLDNRGQRWASERHVRAERIKRNELPPEEKINLDDFLG